MEMPTYYHRMEVSDVVDLINLAGGQTIMEIQTEEIGRIRIMELPNANKYIIRYAMDDRGVYHAESVESAIV